MPRADVCTSELPAVRRRLDRVCAPGYRGRKQGSYRIVSATDLEAIFRQHADDDPKLPEREVGWVTIEASEYMGEVLRIAVRCRKANGQWGYGVLLAPPDVTPLWSVLHPESEPPRDPLDKLLATVYAYDARGGGVETSLKEDKQGLGLGKRQKRRFAAQQMLTLLGTLAHNVLRWARGWLVAGEPRLARYGIKRLVRDIFHITGRVVCDALGRVVRIVLNAAAPLVHGLVAALQALLAPLHIAVTLGET